MCEAEVPLAKGMKMPLVCWKLGGTEQTYYRWRTEYENARIKKLASDGSCIRLRVGYKDDVCAYDFVRARTHDGRPLRMLTLVNEYTCVCLSIAVARRLQRRWLHQHSRGRCPTHARLQNPPPESTVWDSRVESQATANEHGMSYH